MALVKVEYDTVSKQMKCSVDGKMMSDVSGVNLGKCYSSQDGDKPEYYCDLVQMSVDKEHKTITYVRTTASENKDIKPIDESLNKTIKDYLRGE